MPRKQKQRTISGAPPQARPPVAGQTYGKGAEQQRLDQALPMPNRVQPDPHQNAVGAGVAQRAQLGGLIARDTGEAMAATAQQGANIAGIARGLISDGGSLTHPTNRPNEPITAGLSRGPGPGPEALGVVQGTPTGDLMRRIAAATGDSFFVDLANRAGA